MSAFDLPEYFEADFYPDIFIALFISLSNSSINFLGNISEKNVRSLVARISLMLLIETKSRPVASPSFPITRSKKSYPLSLVDPLHINSPRTFNEKTSIILSVFSSFTRSLRLNGTKRG